MAPRAAPAVRARARIEKAWREAERRLGPKSTLRETEYHWYGPLLEALGISEYLEKPCSLGRLLEAVRTATRTEEGQR